MEPNDGSGPARLLDGVRVLDFTSGLAGPYLTRLMVDLGSEVIKVERPVTGDYSRRLPYIVSDGQSGYFIQQNCGKKSISLDLNRPEAIDIVKKLSKKVDVVVEDFQLGFMDSLGIGYPDLVKTNPQLIMCSLSPYGRTGPYASRVSTGRVIATMCGARDPMGAPVPPTGIRIAVTDINASAYALGAVTAGLYYRRKTGVGQHIDVSAMDCLFATLPEVQTYLVSGGTGSYSSPQVFRTRDGRLITMNAWTQDNFWAGVAEAMARPELIKDQRFDTPTHRRGNRDLIDQVISEWVQRYSAQELLERLRETGVPAAPVQSVEEAINDPQIEARGMLVEIEDPNLGKIRIVNSPFRLAETVAGVRGLPPLLGEHNREVLNHLLGYSAAEVTELEAAGVLYAEPQAAKSPARKQRLSARSVGGDSPIAEQPGEATVETKGATKRPGVFEGLRVLDFSRAVAGPFMTRLMVDLGAEVIKVEERVTGDPMRYLGYLMGKRLSSSFTFTSCGKKSISIDLRNPEGLKIVKHLVRISDVVVENFRPGVMDRLGIGYEELKRINPRIIMCSISGFGQWGPYASWRGEAATATAMSGAQDVGDSAAEPPQTYRGFWTDQLGSLLSLAAVGAALYRRDESGTGEYIDLALLDCLFSANDTDIQSFVLSKGKVRPVPLENHHQTMVPLGDFNVQNGRYVFVEAHEDEVWVQLAQAMEKPELARDRRFDTPSRRVENREALYSLVSEWFRKFDSPDQVLTTLEKAGVPAVLVRTTAEAVNDPQLNARGMTAEVVHPIDGKIRVINSPLRYSATDARPAGPPPLLGQHNEEVLTGLLGYSTEELSRLEAEGAISAKETD